MHDLADAAMRYHLFGRTLNGDFPLLSAACCLRHPIQRSSSFSLYTVPFHVQQHVRPACTRSATTGRRANRRRITQCAPSPLLRMQQPILIND